RTPPRPLTLEIGALDRLRFSQAKHEWEIRQYIADDTFFISQTPDAWQKYASRAQWYRKLGEFAKAIKDYQEWIALGRDAATSAHTWDKAWPLRDLALIYLFGPPQFQNFGKALELTHEALSIDPNNPDNHFRHGVAYYRLGQYEEASKHLETARQMWEMLK